MGVLKSLISRCSPGAKSPFLVLGPVRVRRNTVTSVATFHGRATRWTRGSTHAHELALHNLSSRCRSAPKFSHASDADRFPRYRDKN